jgi:hypothetical protein
MPALGALLQGLAEAQRPPVLAAERLADLVATQLTAVFDA